VSTLRSGVTGLNFNSVTSCAMEMFTREKNTVFTDAAEMFAEKRAVAVGRLYRVAQMITPYLRGGRAENV
jgi:uncharacterized DUF497 family protein